MINTNKNVIVIISEIKVANSLKYNAVIPVSFTIPLIKFEEFKFKKFI